MSEPGICLPNDAACLNQERCWRLLGSLPVVPYVSTVREPRQLLFLGPQAGPLLGITPPPPEKSMHPWWLEMIHPEDRARVEQELTHCLATGGDFAAEYRLTNDPERPLWVRDQAHLHQSPQGEPELYGMVMVIDSLRDMQRDLHQNQMLQDHLFHLLDQVVYTLDPQGRILKINPAIELLLGYDPKEVVGRYIYDFLHDPTQVPEFRRRMEQALEVGLQEGHIAVATRAGERRVLAYRSAALQVPGRAAVIHGTARDVTDQLAREREMQSLEGQLLQAQKMEAIATLTAGIAHDFNNLLQALYGYNQLLAMDMELSPKSRKLVGQQEKVLRRAGDMVRRLLTFSRKANPDKVLLDLNRVVRRAAKVLEMTLPRDIQVVLKLHPELPLVKGDGNQLEQVIMNLASNARDAMARGGTLVISTDCQYLSEAQVKGLPELSAGDYVELSVSDQGEGMDPATLEHIFDPFFTTKPQSQGKGLGLSVVYGIVKSHAGHISVRSQPGRGTTFRVNLAVGANACRGPMDATSGGTPTRTTEGGEETVLMVDDETPVLEVGRELLERFGYTVLTATSGEEALEIYGERGRDIDLVILDLMMPGMGGEACMTQLRQIDPSVKILIASGYVTAERERYLVPGEVSFIAKPFHIQAMLSAVRHALNQTPAKD